MTQTLHGVIHGKTIELADAPGFTEGAEVEVSIRPTAASRQPDAGKAMNAEAVSPVWTDEDDRILGEIERARRTPSHRELPE